jgi:hypothetical protein
LQIKFDKYNCPQQPSVYLGSPNHKIICALNGIDEESFSLRQNLNNTYELSFDVNRYLTIDGMEIESNAYHLIDLFMRIYVTDIGWFLLQPPETNHDGVKEIKSVTAESAEIEMQQHDIKDLKINQGTTDSYEMLDEDNVEFIGGVEFAKKKITFYNAEDSKYSLMDILLDVSGLKGWSVGYIDPVPKIYLDYKEGILEEKQVMLCNEAGSFDIGTQDLYSFLTQDAAQFFGCVFVFDFNAFKINAYRPENLGKDTNINIGFRNLQQSNQIKVDEKNIFTRYRVYGADDLGIEYVNFGSNIIENIDYFLTEKWLSADVIQKYKLWQSDVELNRSLYINYSRLYNEQQNIISELINRVPLDDTSTDWSSFSNQKLLEAQANYQAQLRGYEEFYVDEHKQFDKEALDASSDANDYYQIKEVILPSIYTEISNRLLFMSDEELTDARNNYQTTLIRYTQKYTDANGNFNQALLDASGDAVDYYQIRDILLPAVQQEQNRRVTAPNDSNVKDYIDSYKTDWKLYGLDELQAILDDYQNRKRVLEKGGYSSDYNPDKHTKDIYDKMHQEYLDILNHLDPLFSGSCQEAFLRRQTEVDNAKAMLDQYNTERIDIAEKLDKVKWKHDEYSFTESDLKELSKLYIDNEYTNKYMLLTDSDDAVTAIDEQLKLLSAATEDLFTAAQPQYIYSTSLDNFLTKYEYSNYVEHFNLGDFIYLGVRDDYVVKLRVTAMDYNPLTMDNKLQIEFSNMIRSKAGRNDFSYMLDLSGGHGKSSSSGSSNNFLSNEGVTLTSGLIQKLLQAGAFSNKVGQLINNEFAGYIGNFISVKNLNAEMIKVTDIIGENGFFEYLQNRLISTGKIIADSGAFKQLDTLVAKIRSAVMGTTSTETGIIIKLTADNAVIDEAFIKWLIAQYISVNELKAGNINTNNINVLSEDGNLSIIGNTQTFRDKHGHVRIQIGEDAKGDFTFVIYNESGNGILMDAAGIKDSAISDGLIKNNMIADNTIGKEKVNWESAGALVDDLGNISWNAAQITVDGKGIDVTFSSILNSLEVISQKTNSLLSQINAIELYGEQIFTETANGILPSLITIFAKCKGDTIIDKWFLDDIENTQYVSQNKLQLMIPSSYMENKTSATVRAQNADGSVYDVFTLYKISDGSADPFTIILTNESVLFSVDSAGYPVTDQNYKCKVLVYKGTESISDFTIGKIESANGIAVSQTKDTITISTTATTALDEKTGELPVHITINDMTFERPLTWSVVSTTSDIFTGNFTSSKGTVFDKSILEETSFTTLTAHVLLGNREIDPDLYWVKWFQQKDNDTSTFFSDEKTVTLDLHDFETSNDIYFEFDFYETYNLSTDDGFLLTTDENIPLVIKKERT